MLKPARETSTDISKYILQNCAPSLAKIARQIARCKEGGGQSRLNDAQSPSLHPTTYDTFINARVAAGVVSCTRSYVTVVIFPRSGAIGGTHGITVAGR